MGARLILARPRWLTACRQLFLGALLALCLGAAPRGTAHAEDIVHLVQPGENLYRIGLRYDVSWVDIAQANGITGATIYPGQQLKIPAGPPPAGEADPAAAQPTPAPTDPPAAEAPALEAATPVPDAASGSATYVVRRGDFVSAIAARFGVSTARLVAANKLVNPSLIYAGQTLVIPGASQAQAPVLPQGGAKQIVVDLSEQRMYLYHDGALIQTFVVSTGEPGRETRPGQYSVLNKIPNAYASTWDLWMPNWLGIYWAGRLQNGIHALPILSNGHRLWDGLLGRRVSYGCVILGIQEAQMLYDWAEVGTPVVIQA